MKTSTKDYLGAGPRTFTAEEIASIRAELQSSQSGNINAAGVDDIQVSFMLMCADMCNANNVALAMQYSMAWHDWQLNLDQRSKPGIAPVAEPLPQRGFVVALDDPINHAGQAGWPTLVQTGPPVCDPLKLETAKPRTKPIAVSVGPQFLPGKFLAAYGDTAPVGHRITHNGMDLVRGQVFTRGFWEVVAE